MLQLLTQNFWAECRTYLTAKTLKKKCKKKLFIGLHYCDTILLQVAIVKKMLHAYAKRKSHIVISRNVQHNVVR